MTESEQAAPVQPIRRHKVGFHTLSGKARGSVESVVAFHGAFFGDTFQRLSRGAFGSTSKSRISMGNRPRSAKQVAKRGQRHHVCSFNPAYLRQKVSR